MAVAHIRRPKDFTLPASRDAILTMLEELKEDDLNRLATELVEALVAARDKDDLLPVRHVLEAWYRTVLLRRDSDHSRVVYDARARAEGRIPKVETQTVDELRAEIKRHRAAS
ncbi:MAG: DUF6247 family protein [Candidatus Dormibacterales bacterium]